MVQQRYLVSKENIRRLRKLSLFTFFLLTLLIGLCAIVYGPYNANTASNETVQPTKNIVTNVPELFSGFVKISNAQLLANNRAFIKNIYEEVNANDNKSALVHAGEYVRVTFAHNLTNKNDITLYGLSVSGKDATIQVYQKSSSKEIAVFENVSSNANKKYRILLSNLPNGISQNTFDLRVLGADVSLNYIVDPQLPNTDPNLILLYHFDNDSGYGEDDTHIHDYSSSGLDATTVGSGIKFMSGIGVLGSGAFNVSQISNTNYFTLPFNAALTVANKSFSFWRDFNTTNGGFGGYEYAVGTQFAIEDQYDSFYVAYRNSTGGNVATYYPTMGDQANGWVHIVVAFNVTGNKVNITVYKNGAYFGGYENTTSGYTSESAGSITVDGFPSNIGTPRMDEFAIFNRTLTAADAHSLYSLVNLDSCGTLVYPGTYKVVADMSSFNTNCITIGADGITIDGGGHKITATGAALGIDVAQHTNFVLQNLRIISSNTSVYNISNASTFQNLTINSSNGAGIDGLNSGAANNDFFENDNIYSKYAPIAVYNNAIIANSTLNISSANFATGVIQFVNNAVITNNTFNLLSGSVPSINTLYALGNTNLVANNKFVLSTSNSIPIFGETTKMTFINNVITSAVTPFSTLVAIGNYATSDVVIANNTFNLTSASVNSDALTLKNPTQSGQGQNNHIVFENNTFNVNTSGAFVFLNATNMTNSTFKNNTVNSLSSLPSVAFITLTNSTNVTFSKNTFNSASTIPQVVNAAFASQQLNNFTTDNQFNGNPITYTYDLSNYVYNGSGNKYDAVYCLNCKNITYTGFNMFNVGFTLSNNSNTIVTNTTITNSINNINILSFSVGQNNGVYNSTIVGGYTTTLAVSSNYFIMKNVSITSDYYPVNGLGLSNAQFLNSTVINNGGNGFQVTGTNNTFSNIIFNSPFTFNQGYFGIGSSSFLNNLTVSAGGATPVGLAAGANNQINNVTITSSGNGIDLQNNTNMNLTNIFVTSAGVGIINFGNNSQLANSSITSTTSYGIWAGKNEVFTNVTVSSNLTAIVATTNNVFNLVRINTSQTLNAGGIVAISGNIIENSSIYSPASNGYPILFSDNNLVRNNTIKIDTSYNSGVSFSGLAFNNRFLNNTFIIGAGNEYGINFNVGYPNSNYNNTVANNLFYTNGGGFGGDEADALRFTGPQKNISIVNNTFYNTAPLGGGIRGALAIYSTGGNVPNINITIANNTFFANSPVANNLLMELDWLVNSTVINNTITSVDPGNTYPLINLVNDSNITFIGNNLYGNYSKPVNITISQYSDYNQNFGITNFHNGLPLTYNFGLSNYVLNGSSTLNKQDDIICVQCNNVVYNNFNLTNAQVLFYNSNYVTLNNSYLRETRSGVTFTFYSYLSSKSQISNTVVNTTAYAVAAGSSDNFTASNITVASTSAEVMDFSSSKYASIQDSSFYTYNYGIETSDDIFLKNVQILGANQGYLGSNSQLVNVNITAFPGATSPVIKTYNPIYPLNNMTFTNVIINTSNAASIGIDLGGGSNNTFTNVTIYSGNTSVYNVSNYNSFNNVTSSSSNGNGIDANSNYINVTNSNITSLTLTAIIFGSHGIIENNTINGHLYSVSTAGSNNIIRNNTFDTNGSYNGDLALYGSVNNLITLNRFINVAHRFALSLSGNIASPTINTTIANNIFNVSNQIGDSQQRGLLVITGGLASNVSITNNTFVVSSPAGNAPFAINIQPASTAGAHVNLTIRNNTIFSTTPFSSSLINISNTQNSTINNNTFTSTNAGNTAPLIYVYNSSGINFTANRLYANYSTFMYSFVAGDAPIVSNSFAADNYANGYQVTYGYNLRNAVFNGSNSSTPEPIVCYYCSNVTYYNYRLVNSNISLYYSNSTSLINSTIASTNAPDGAINITAGNNYLIQNSTINGNSVASVLATSVNNITILGSTTNLIKYVNTDNSTINGSTINVTGGNFGINFWGNNNKISSNIIQVSSASTYGIISNNGAYSNNNITDNLILTSSGAVAIYLSGTTNYRIYRNNFVSTTIDPTQDVIRLSSATNTIIENNTISSTTNGISETGGSTGTIINGTNITTTLCALNITGATTNLFIIASRLNSSSSSAIAATASASVYINDSFLSGSTKTIEANAGSSGTFNITNTTLSSSTFNAASTLKLFVYNYLRVNLTRINITPLSNIAMFFIRNDSLFNLTVYTNPSGLTNFTPMLQYFKNATTTIPSTISAQYAIQNATSIYYINTNVTISNATLLPNITAENPTTNLQINYTNETITNYNFGQQYLFQKNIVLTAFNSSITNLTIGVSEVNAGLGFLNSSAVAISCPSIQYESTCTLRLNITLNNGVSPFNSDFNYSINYTQRDRTVVHTSFLSNVVITQFVAISFNTSQLVYNDTLNNTKTDVVIIKNIGSASTGNINLTAVNGSDFFSFFNVFDQPITGFNSISEGANVTLKVRFTLTNYSVANYVGGIEAASLALNQTLPFNITVVSAVSAPLDLSLQHNTTTVYSWNITNTGNVPLQNLQTVFTNNTIPLSWITYNNLISTNLLPGQSIIQNITLQIPPYQDPAIYDGTFTFTADNGINQNITTTITVPINRSWVVMPGQINVSQNISDSSSNENLLPVISIMNNGNVGINISAVPIFSGYGDIDFQPQSKFLSVAGQGGTLTVSNLSKNTTTTLQLRVKSYVIAELTPPKTNMGLRFNFTLENTSDSTNSSIISAMLVSIHDQPPDVGSWWLNNAPVPAGWPLEINKLQSISAFAVDDGNKINTSTALFIVTDGGIQTNYTPTDVISGRYILNITPRHPNNFTVAFSIQENIVDGGKVGSGNITFNVNPKPDTVIISSNGANVISTNYSNSTDDIVLNRTLLVRVNGNVSIYNATIYATPPNGWSYSNSTFSAITQNNTNVPTAINITVPKGTTVGNYSFNIYVNYTNPDGTLSSSSMTTRIEVLPNSDFVFNITDNSFVALQNITQQHGTNVTYYVTLVPKGNANTTINISTNNTLYSVQYFNGFYSNTASNIPLTTNTNTNILTRISIPLYSGINNTFNIIVVTAQGKVFSTPVQLYLPVNQTFTTSPSTVNKSLVAGDVFVNDSFVNITNTGNVPLTIAVGLSGNITNFGGFGGAGIIAPQQITIPAGTTVPVPFNYTAATVSTTFNGTLTLNITGAVGNVTNATIPIRIQTFNFLLSAYNFSHISNALSGDQIEFISNLLAGSVFVSQNITYAPIVNGQPCSSVNIQPISVAGDINFIVHCLLPTLPDGFNYSLVVKATYNSPIVGTIATTSPNTASISYLDITSPAIINVSIPDAQANTPQTVIINATDNVPITDSNSGFYTVTIQATHTASGQITSTTLDRILGTPGSFTSAITYTVPGAYTYIASITDPTGNVNSTYTGAFTIYQFKNFTSTIQYFNNSGVLVGANINISLTASANQFNITVTNGSLNATTRTGIYQMNVTDKTSTLSLNAVDILNQPSNNLITYGQLKQNEYVILAQQLFSTLDSSNIFNGFYFRLNETTQFNVKYNYSSYNPSSENGVKAFACFNYTVGADPLTACSGGFVELTRTSLSTINKLATFTSPISTTPNSTVAIVFFTYVVIGQPAAAFASSNISATMQHGTTTSIPFSITSVLNVAQGGTLTGITFDCINNAGSITDVCSHMNVTSFSLSSLSQGLTQPFSVGITVPLGTPAGLYTGTMRYKSNLNSTTPLLYDIPIYVTVVPTTSYTFTKVWPNGFVPIYAGTGSPVIMDTYTFNNTGNSLVPLTFTSNGTILSNTTLNIPIGQTATYQLQMQAVPTMSTQAYAFRFGAHVINYTVITNTFLNITNTSPTLDIVPGTNLLLYFDLYENSTDPSNIIQSSQPYFDSYSITIDNISCISSVATAVFDSNSPDLLTCTIPSQTVDKANYTLQLNLTRNGVLTTSTQMIAYRDLLAPSISNVVQKVSYFQPTNISFSLMDRSGINFTNMHMTVKDVNANSTVGSYTGVTSLNATNNYGNGIFNTSSNSFLLQHNFSSSGDYVLDVTYCDQASNCANLSQKISYYPDVAFTQGQIIGQNSSIISAGIQTDSNQWKFSPPQMDVFFKRPNTSEILATAYIDSANGRLNITSLQNRTYDIFTNSTNFDLKLYNVPYNGSPIISFQQVNASKITNGALGFSFSAPMNYSAEITLRVPKDGSFADAKFAVCSQWDFDAGCLNSTNEVVPIVSSTTATQYVFTLNVSHFSAYILTIPPISTPTPPPAAPPSGGGGSSGGSSGGGGSGASLSAIADLLNATVNNLSKISPNPANEIRADIPRIEQNLYPGESIDNKINLINTGNDSRLVTIDISPEIAAVTSIDPTVFTIAAGTTHTVDVVTRAPPEVFNQTNYQGSLKISYNGQSISIPVLVRLLESPRQPASVSTNILTPTLNPTGTLRLQVSINYPYIRAVPATITYSMFQQETGNLVWSQSADINLSKPESWTKDFYLDGKFKTGNYYMKTELVFSADNNQIENVNDVKTFTISENLFYYQVFRLGDFQLLLWHVILALFLALIVSTTYLYAKKKFEQQKRYHLPVEVQLLPQPGPAAGYLGHLAETSERAFVEFEQLKMHTLVAGSTGGGKSFAAQVFVEEALKNNTAVVVFDPTAQWTGFLRKNTNETLLRLYSHFHMDPKKDPRSFKGNIRRIENPLEVIELKEYLKPGEITVFDCHKMTFEQIDLFVANTVSQVFMAELEESRDLKLLMVYDEVHRLLPKFGGSGAGFMQIERACREFRKWGIGVLLISQVLSDFIGQIKANINTEVQMRTRDEEDLKRLSLKYGDDLLHAVVKAEVGTGMVQNSKYNKGRPWLISFRPVLHAVERLTEKELKDYDIYNTQLEDLMDSLTQLENYKVDVVDMRIELDLAYDKLKEGKFDVVQIYLEELRTKVSKNWDKLKKKPTKRVKKLLDKKTVEKFLDLAKRQHYEAASADAANAANNNLNSNQNQTAEMTANIDVANQSQTTSAKKSGTNTATTLASVKSEKEKAPAPTTKAGKAAAASAAKKEKADAKSASAKASKAAANGGGSSNSASPTNSGTAAATVASSGSAKDKLAKLRAALGK